MQGYGAGPGAPGMTRNVAAGGYPSQQGGGKGAPPAGGAATGAAQTAGQAMQGPSRPGMGAATGAAQMAGQAMQGPSRPGMGAAMAGANQNVQNARAQMLNQQAIAANGQEAVSDYYNKLMENQQNPMAQRMGAAQQMMRGAQGMRRPNEFPQEMQQMAPLLMQQLLARGIAGR